MCAGILASCQPSTSSDEADSAICAAAGTPIAVIQGDGDRSPLTGSGTSIQGIVTRVAPGSGFYLEEPGADDSATTSNGIYVADEPLSGLVEPGQQWMISGQVSETGPGPDTVTTLSAVSNSRLCATGLTLPQTLLALPMNEDQREAAESMRVSLQGPLFVTDVYHFSRGEVVLSAGGALRVPTEDVPAGAAAEALKENNQQRSIRAALVGGDSSLVHNGSDLGARTGVMGHTGTYRVLMLDPGPKTDLASPDPAPPAGPHLTRVVSMNLLNFFNGDGDGKGFPTERGAKTREDFVEQAHRIQSALVELQPALLAVQELENDGYGPGSAAQSLIQLLKAAVPAEWAVVETGNDGLGSDVITVALFYRPDLLEAVGPPHTLDSPPFADLSRQPLAQRFRERTSGTEFLIAVNHLKSKGGCPQDGDNADQGDGQGCWNPARVAAVAAETEWLDSLAADASTDLVLIVGDMNSHRNEEPILTFGKGGYTEAVEYRSGLPQYSYVYSGEAGTLDYAFASPALLNHIQRAEIWHINADWPAKTPLPHAWMRFSDHDPVVVDLAFSQSATPD